MDTIHITLSFLFFSAFYFGDVFGVRTRHSCRPEQRDALVEFKNEFEIGKSAPGCYYDDPIKSWKNNSDCCYWYGIKCDAKTREVVELHLSCSRLYGRFQSNSSLFKLQNLRFLTLSHNNLHGQIPSSLVNLSHLTSLYLSSNQFSGQIPTSIGSLSHLTSLVLSNNKFSGKIPSSIGNLSLLTILRLSDNQFSGQIPSSVGKLFHLTFLDFYRNQFSGQFPSSIGNLSYLTSLDFSNNQFSGQIPSSVGKLSLLTYLHFSQNNFVGEIPSSFGSLNQLTHFGVDSNKVSGNFPISLLNLTNLWFLSLSYNHFTGPLPPNISSLSNLVSVDASHNTFVGTLPSSLFTLPSLTSIYLENNQLNNILEFGKISSPSNLQQLNLGNNNFRGPIPSSISKLFNLGKLDLSHWNTQGPVDFNIFWHLKWLQSLSLSYLNTTTTIDLNEISSFSKSLESLDLSGNHVLATNKSSVLDPPSQSLSNLKLSGCGITEFPELLRTQQHMESLVISNNKIKGQVPGWLWKLPKLYHVDLSNNTFISFEKSTKHVLSFVFKHLFGSRNNFTGEIPSFICMFPSLETLDLSNNNFDSSVPLCLGNLKSTLSVLNLHHNQLSGGLPGNVFERLRSFDVGHNQLVGKLPRSLMNFSTLEVLNVESNLINDTFPFWLSSLQNLTVLVLRSNAFHGPIRQASFFTLKIIDISHNHFNGVLPSDYFVNWSAMSSPGKKEDLSNENYIGGGYYHDSMVLMNKGVELELVRILKIYTALDFSGNKFEGKIPNSIGLLKELHVLNLSNNAFTGNIPSSMGNLTALESLDVSQNKLLGEIPQELGNLSYLAYMNFSHNKLVGQVPGGTQFRRQPCSSFEGNSGLFGSALDEDCRDIRTPSSQQYETPEVEEAEEKEEVFSWTAAAIGFGPGIVFGLAIGYILICYKPEWFISPFGPNKRRSRRAIIRERGNVLILA